MIVTLMKHTTLRVVRSSPFIYVVVLFTVSSPIPLNGCNLLLRKV
jgi:hypothetical protein